MSEQVNNMAQVGEGQARPSDRVRCLDGLTGHADGLVELATLGQDRAQASGIESVIAGKRRRVDAGKSSAGGYLGGLTLLGD